eukprot:g6617.t1
MAADRGKYIDQSQSLNIHMTDVTSAKLMSMHFHGWSRGLKTGMYYLRTKAAADAIKFTVEVQKSSDESAIKALKSEAPTYSCVGCRVTVAGHGGKCNASTGDAQTCYVFDVAPLQLAGALDRFCQFFRTPLFTESATEREINAVDSEHSMRLQDDGRRSYAALLLDANPQHPLHWGSGNAQSLREEPKKRGVELAGSQTLLSGSVQLNIFSKCVIGLIVAPLSDKIGRRPIIVTCTTLLILGSFGCALAPDVGWFLASRILQSLGESLEPVTFAILRDCFPEPQDRLAAVSVVRAFELFGIFLGPVVGGLVASFSHWRVPFFLLTLAWAGLAHYAAFCIHETAVDTKDPPSYKQSFQRVFWDPQLVTLLMTETLVLSTYYAFDSNISYLTEGLYGKGTGPGSLLSALKASGWATSLSAGTTDFGSFSQFQVTIALTEQARGAQGTLRACNQTHTRKMYCDQGLEKIQEIGQRLFTMIGLLRATPVQFRFADDSQPYNLVSRLARNLQNYPPEEVLAAPVLLSEPDVVRTKDFLQHLMVAQLRIGRRPIFVTCALLLILGSFGCAFAPNVSWFLAARVIQSLGESLEPLIFAILRDCYPKPEDRLVAWSVVLALEMIGIAIGPVLGGLVASFSHWRVPFFLLSLAWAGLANYAAFCVHETAVDVKDPPSYWSSVKRVFTDRQLVTLLVAETFVLSTYYTVNANISYLTEGVYGKSTVMTSWLMGAFASIAAAGMILVTNADTDVLSTAKQWMMAFSLGSGSSFVIAAVFFSHYLWSYLGSSFLMGFTLACYLPLGVLFMETLEDIAGTAASFEVFAQAGPPSIYSALATQGIIHDGQRGLTWFQAASALLAGAVFWTTFSFRACGESSEEAEETSEDPPK